MAEPLIPLIDSGVRFAPLCAWVAGNRALSFCGQHSKHPALNRVGGEMIYPHEARSISVRTSSHSSLFWLFAAMLLLAFSVTGATAQDTRVFDAENGTFEVPVVPLRIVALNDQILTLPLYELGAPVVGTSGRMGEDGKPFMRGGMDTFGINFENTDIAFVGVGDGLDVEAIAALEPDLIIGLPYTEQSFIDQLQNIAPTVVIDETALGFEGTLRTLAELSGRVETFEARLDRYKSNIERAKEYIGAPQDISVAVTFTFPSGESLSVYRKGLGALTRVIDDLGFKQIDLISEIDDDRIKISPELIEQLDADFIFGFYRHRDTASPQVIFAAYEKFAPGFCQALVACRNHQFVLLPGLTFGGTMESLDLALELVESHVGARQFSPLGIAAE